MYREFDARNKEQENFNYANSLPSQQQQVIKKKP